MEKIKYPLLTYQLKADAILGLLVGTRYQVVDRDLPGIRSAMQEYLQKQYKKYDTYPFIEITDPRLKLVRVTIRPTFSDQRGSYPFPNTLSVPVPVVYGEIAEGYFACYLPLFNQSFYYYDPRQFENLATHFAMNRLNNLPPDQIFRLAQYRNPQLDSVQLKVNYDRSFEWQGFDFHREYRYLGRLAEQYPYPRNIRRNISTLPEAAWELEDKVSEVLGKLVHTHSNVIVVGPHGVGKSAVLKQAMRKISQQGRKQKLEYTFWRVTPQRITASSKYLGEWEQTVEGLIEELESANGILWVVDLIQLLRIGGAGPEDSVAAFLLPYLQRGKLQLVGEATPQELDSMRRLLPGFVENFQVVRMRELPEPKVRSVLEEFARYAAHNLKITVDAKAVDTAYRLLSRYIPYASFPGKGIQFLGQCISEVTSRSVTVIDTQVVTDLFTRQTGLPKLFLRDDLLLDQDQLYRHFLGQVIGQPAAVRKLCEIVKIYKTGLNNPYKPISTLIFAGPTGVGKTASAKALADYFFGQGQKRSPLVRIDMSEFKHPAQISRLIGSGREVGQLVKEIRERPFSVVLLDEVEKADPSIFDALMTVLDEGSLTDAYGRVTDFRNAIIIMTSNLGADNRKAIGYQETTDPAANYYSAIDKHFRPELINRIDGVVIFNPLSDRDIRKIAIKELEALKKREGFSKRQLRVRFTKRVVEHLAVRGFDERYGARPLQRAIEQILVMPIANWLLENRDIYGAGISVDYQEGISITLEP